MLGSKFWNYLKKIKRYGLVEGVVLLGMDLEVSSLHQAQLALVLSVFCLDMRYKLSATALATCLPACLPAAKFLAMTVIHSDPLEL